jgi:uroporphyrin-3 C-methyltransferase
VLHHRDDTRRELEDFRIRSSIESQSMALSQLRQSLSDQGADARVGREQLAAQIDKLQLRQQEQWQRLEALTTTDRSDWRLAEAEYLLQLANQRLLMGGDPKVALEQLTAADAIVRAIDDSALLPTRAALARDIAALKAVEVVDVDGIYLAINAVAEQAARLRLINPPALREETAAAAPAPANWGERLQNGLRAALAKLDQLVQIRRRDQPYQPLLAPQYEAALRQNLQLMFEQAQMALLSGNQKLYEHSLEKAHSWLTTYFTVDEQATQTLAQTIDELRAKHVRVALPDVSESRHALQVYLKSRHAQAASAGTTSP